MLCIGMILMSETVRVRGMMNVTLEVPFTAEIDMDDFLEWSDGEDLDIGLAEGFLDSDRNFPENLGIDDASASVHKITEQYIERVMF